MELLPEDSSQIEAIDLSQMGGGLPTTSPVPESSIRNRAATSAILSGSDKIIADYKQLINEGTEGDDTTHNRIMEGVASSEKTKHMGALMRILGNPSIPLEKKRPLMGVVELTPKVDPKVVLASSSLEKGSEGEDVRGMTARIALVDSMAKLNKAQEQNQKIINSILAAHPDTSAETVGDMAAVEVMPFGRNIIGAKVAGKLGELTGAPVSIGGWVKNFLMPGSTRDEIQRTLESIPVEKRYEYSQKIADSIKESASIFHSENYYAQYKQAIDLLDSPRQTDTEIWTSNMFTLLDAFWVGSEIRAGVGALKASKAAATAAKEETIAGNFHLVDEPASPVNPFAARIGKEKPALPAPKAEDTVRRIKSNSVVRRENPVSVYSVVEQTNPEQARSLHKTIVEGTDEVAFALAGVSREQAIINNVYPQVGTESGSVLNKVDQSIVDAVENTGATRYTPEELVSATDTIKQDFRNATGLKANDAMSTFRMDGDHMIIDAHYGTQGGAFVTPEVAKEQAKYALRGYGVRDDEIVVMKRSGMDYVVANAGDVAAGDYMIKVSSKVAISDNMVTSWNPLEVKYNWADRLSTPMAEYAGIKARNFMDPGSMFDPVITRAATVATDQTVPFEIALLKPIKDFRNQMSVFKADRKLKVEDYIKEANLKGIAHDNFSLTARGFTDPEIKALESWKEIWDTNFYLENFDLIRTLRSQNFQVFDNQGTKLFGKPVAKNQNIGRVLDVQSGNVRNLSVSEMDSLYNQGGSYVALRRPITVQGFEVEHMMVRNTPSEHMRGLRDTDMALNYREGFYHIEYSKGSKFIDKIDATGKRSTVAVARNTKDAEMFKNSQTQVTGERYEIREDVKGYSKEGDGYWDVNNASGRISQRVRGTPLNTASGSVHLGPGVYTENPMDSAVRAAKSIAGRTMTRPMLETAKRRFIEQYGDMWAPNKVGGRDFPTNKTQIVDPVSHVSSRTADARSTFEYIKFLEQGYINTADSIFQGGMHIMSQMSAKAGFSKGEEIASAIATGSPSTFLKGTVFQAYIVGSVPIRQWIVQSWQATRLLAYNPLGLVASTDRFTGYMRELIKPGSGSQLSRDFMKFVDESGMVAGVDRNSLVRGIGLSMADSSSDFKRVMGNIASFPQTVGFDIGEKMNQLFHLAAVHEKWTRRGADLTDKTVRDLAFAEARDLGYAMNKAGEYAYTTGSASVLLQFLQMPHKALNQMLNRNLDTATKLRMAGMDLIMFGAPVGAISAVVTAAGGDGGDILPDDPMMRDLFVYGMTSTFTNALLTKLDSSGEQTRLDLTALANTNMDGWTKMLSALVDGEGFAALAASPAGQLFAMEGVNGSRRDGRIPQALMTMGRYFNVFEEIDPENPTEFKAVVNDLAKITSGWTALDNALIMLELRKKQDRLGVTVDSSVTVPEIAGAFMGFGTLTTKELYELTQRLSKDTKHTQESRMRKYNAIMAHTKENLSQDNPDISRTQRTTSMLMRTFKDDPEGLAMVHKQWGKDMLGKEQGLVLQMWKGTTLPGSTKFLDSVRMAPNLTEEQKAIMIQRYKDAQQLNKGNK
jgi:hypothetical protein